MFFISRLMFRQVIQPGLTYSSIWFHNLFFHDDHHVYDNQGENQMIS